MTPDRNDTAFHKTARQVFEDAMALPVADRISFAERACADNSDLRGEVVALLEAATHTAFLEDPVAHVAFDGADNNHATVVTGATHVDISGYSIHRHIASGGQSHVYLATKETPPEQQVALKIVRQAPADPAEARQHTETVVAGLRHECQVQAILSHDAIAKIFDFGTTNDGLAFYAMEFVDGQPATDYADQHRLSIRERLRLFLRICDAIAHAHQRGVIHRDIKPANVLVRSESNLPQPKVIDFGISRSLVLPSDASADRRAEGTLEYMPPEQANTHPTAQDTRQDVYALGVLLCNLLCGTTPRAAKAGWREADLGRRFEMIREIEAIPPSDLLVDAPDPESVCAARRTTPDAASRQFRHDLDAIVMKCIADHPDRRFQTVNELAERIRFHLEDRRHPDEQPRLARRMRRFVRRNRTMLAVLTITCGPLLLALMWIGWTLAQDRLMERPPPPSAEVHQRQLKTWANLVRKWQRNPIGSRAEHNAWFQELEVEYLRHLPASDDDRRFSRHAEAASYAILATKAWNRAIQDPANRGHWDEADKTFRRLIDVIEQHFDTTSEDNLRILCAAYESLFEVHGTLYQETDGAPTVNTSDLRKYTGTVIQLQDLHRADESWTRAWVDHLAETQSSEVLNRLSFTFSERGDLLFTNLLYEASGE